MSLKEVLVQTNSVEEDQSWNQAADSILPFKAGNPHHQQANPEQLLRIAMENLTTLHPRWPQLSLQPMSYQEPRASISSMNKPMLLPEDQPSATELTPIGPSLYQKTTATRHPQHLLSEDQQKTPSPRMKVNLSESFPPSFLSDHPPSFKP